MPNLLLKRDREKSQRVIYFLRVVFNWGVMAGLNFIWSKGAAGLGEATKEIDFVPHIRSCSLAGTQTAQQGAMCGHAGVRYSVMHFFISERRWWLDRLVVYRQETWEQSVWEWSVEKNMWVLMDFLSVSAESVCQRSIRAGEHVQMHYGENKQIMYTRSNCI